MDEVVLWQGYHVDPRIITHEEILPPNGEQCRHAIQILGCSGTFPCLDRVGHPGDHAYAVQFYTNTEESKG